MMIPMTMAMKADMREKTMITMMAMTAATMMMRKMLTLTMMPKMVMSKMIA